MIKFNKKTQITSFKKHIAVFTVTCFLFTTLAGQGYAGIMPGAAPVVNSAALGEIANKVIPFNIGKITDALYSGKSGSVVINIQDLHSHAETQRNISTILSILDKKYGLDRVYVEGAYGEVNTKWLSGVKDKKIKEEILKNMLESGRLTGSEYYAVESGRERVIEGIEEKQVYIDNLKRLNEIYKKKQEIGSYIPHIEYILEKKAEIYYSQSNRKLNRIIKKNKAGEISAERYFTYLMQAARKGNIDLSKYRGIINFIVILEKQRKIDAGKINAEISGLLTELKGKLSYDQYRQLTGKLGDKATESEFYFDLLKVAESKGLMGESRYRNINLFLEYMILSQSVNPIELTYEEKGLVREIHNRFAVNEFEREIYFLKEYVEYMKGYLNNKLTADEYEYFTANMGTFRVMWKKYVDIDGIIDINRYMELFEKFYSENVERNRYFIKNVMGIMPQEEREGVRIKADVDHQGKVLEEINGKKDIKVVITGGFHTYGFTKLLEDEGISYIVVTPNVTESAATAEQKYEEIFRQQSEVLYNTLQKMFVSQLGKGAVLNADVLKAVSGRKNILSILNQMLADLNSKVKLTSFNKTENGFVFTTEDGQAINIVTEDKTQTVKKTEASVSEKDLYATFFAVQQLQNLNKKIRQARRAKKSIGAAITKKELDAAGEDINRVVNNDLRNALRNKLGEIIFIYNDSVKQTDDLTSDQNIPAGYVSGMNEAIEQVRLAEKSRSWFLSFIQPPVGAYMINGDGVEGRAFNYTDSLLHAETFAIINFLENYITKSRISRIKKEELFSLLNKIKLNGKTLKSAVFKDNELVRALGIDYENKTIEDLFNETNVMLRYIDGALKNPVKNSVLFCTLAPCNKCAGTIISLKFKTIVFGSYPANRTHKNSDKIYSNGTEIVPGVMRKETDKYIYNYRVMNSSALKTNIASVMQKLRRKIIPFMESFEKDKNTESKNAQLKELVKKLSAYLAHSDKIAEGLDYAVLCGNDNLAIFKYALDMLENGKIKKMIISGGCGRLTMPLLKMIRTIGVRETGIASLDVFLSMNNEEFENLENEISKLPNPQIKNRLRQTAPGISEAEIIKFIMLNILGSDLTQAQKSDIESRIMLETESGNTLENIQYAKKMLPESAKKIGIIQTPVQQLRTMATAGKVFAGEFELYSLTTDKIRFEDKDITQAVLGEYARLIIYTLKGDILPLNYSDKNNSGLNAVDEEIYEEIFVLINNLDKEQQGKIKNYLRTLFKPLGDDSYETVSGLLNQRAEEDKVSKTKTASIERFINWIYTESEELPSISKFLDRIGITQENHRIIRASIIAVAESPYIFVSSLSEKFQEWFLRQHAPNHQTVRKAGLETIVFIVRISTVISLLAVTLTSFGLIPAVSITIALIQWVMSLILPHIIWNIKNPHARLEKEPRGERKNYDVYRIGKLVAKGKRSPSKASIINTTAYNLCEGRLWEKNQIEYELRAEESEYQETVAPEETSPSGEYKIPLQYSGDGILFKVVIPNINNKLPAQYQYTYAHSPKGAAANILFKIFKAIKEGKLTNGRYVDVPYLMDTAEETADYNNIGDDTDDAAVSDKNIVKILAIIFKDYNLGDIIEEHKSNSLPLRTDKPVSRIVKKELKAYRVAISGLNKHKSLEVYQQVYASSEEEAVKNAVRELVLAKERGELILGWYGDIAVNRKNIDKIAAVIYSKYADKIDHIVTEIPEVTKISEAADGRSAVKKETRQKEIETSREFYPEFTQNIQYKFTVSIPIAGTKNVFNDTVEAYSPKQALFKALLRYYKNREKALEQERALWTEYDIKTLGGMLNCKMNMPPFTVSDSEYVMPEQKDGEKEYIVTIPGLNDTKELARYRRVYAISPEDAVKKAVLALVAAKQRKELSSGWYAGIGISINKAADISDAVFKQHPYDVEKFIKEVKREPLKKPENEIIKDEINELQQIINWNDLSVSDLPRLKAFLEKIGAWDNKLARAGMMYVIENKITAKIGKDGKIIFTNKDGVIFNYWISPEGRFEAAREYFEKMGQLSRILNIADMDENIAPRAKVMDARMKNIFSKLHLYDIGKPVIVTGAMFQRLKSRIDDISPVIIDLIDQIFIVSARERITYDGENWILDDHYLDEFSKARMLAYDKKMIHEAFYNDIEVPWHDLFIRFADDLLTLFSVNRRPSFEDFINAAVSREEYGADIEYIVKILNLKDDNELFQMFETKKRKEIKNIINIIYKETKAKENKDRLLKIMRLVSILELIRVYRSGVEEDFSEKDYIMSEAFKREPMVPNNERTTYIVTQIRPMAVRDCLVDYCSDVILSKGLDNFSIRAGGKSTIDFFKNNTNKAVAIEYLSKRFNIPSGRIIYSGDELSVGVDACVVDLKNSVEENYGDLVILNTGREEVEGTVPLHSIYPNISGIAANTLMFERIFDFISYNIAMIATKPDFKPANIVADLKDSVQIPDEVALSEPEKNADKIKSAAFIDFAAENIKKIILFMQLFIINFMYKDTTSYTIIADASDVKKTELAVYLAENGVKVNLILKGDSGLQTENKRGLKNGFALIEKKGNLTKYGYEQTTAVPEEEIFKELIEDVSQEDMSKNKIIDVSDFQLTGIDEQSLKNIFAKNGAKTVIGTGASSNSLFMALLEEVKINPANSVSAAKPLVSVNITEADLTEYNNRQYLQMKKNEGIDSIVISVDNKMLNENSAAISGLLKLAHEEGLKVEFMYFIANQEELELLTGHIDERMRNYRAGGTGIDGLRLDLSKLVYNEAVKRELIRLKMTVNKQSLNALFAVELYDIPQELLDDYGSLVKNLAIVQIKSVDKITAGDDLTKIIIKLAADKKTNTVFNIKTILDLNPSMIQMSSDLLNEIIKADNNLLNTTMQKAARILSYVYDVSPQGMYNRGLQYGRRTGNNSKLSAKDTETLYELLKAARAGNTEIFENETFKKLNLNAKNINEVSGFLQGLLESVEYNRYSASNKPLNFANPQFKYVFASALVENKILGNISRDEKDITNDFVREQIKTAQELALTADRTLAAGYYANINTAVNILNGIKSMDAGLVTEQERAVAVSLLLEIMPMAEQYVQMSLLDEEETGKDISKITRALLASA